MRRALHIAGKELLQIRRDKLAALFTIVLPVVFTVFLGLLMSDMGESTLPLAVADADNSGASKQLLQQLADQPAIRLDYMTADEIETAVLDQQVAAGIIIPAGYGSALESGRQASIAFVRIETSSGAQSVLQAVESVIEGTNTTDAAAAAAIDALSSATDAGGGDLSKKATSLAAAQVAAPTVSVKIVASSTDNGRQITGFEQASSGELVNWVLFALLTTATGLALERRLGLIKRLNTTGARGTEIFGGKLLAMLVITFVQQLFLVILGQLAFGVDYFSSPLALLAVMVSLSVLASSMGLLIASVFRSEQAVIATTVIAAMLLAVLAGAWFPLDITSSAFSSVAHFLPGAWVVDSLHGIILKSWGITEILRPMGFVWIWIVVFFGLAVWRFRPE
jgi:ABC-2 type transport system permease protein